MATEKQPTKKPKSIKDRLNEAFGKMSKKDEKSSKGGCNCGGKGTCPACKAKAKGGDCGC